MPALYRDSAHTCVIRSAGWYLECQEKAHWVPDAKDALFFTPEEAAQLVERSGLGWEVEEVRDG